MNEVENQKENNSKDRDNAKDNVKTNGSEKTHMPHFKMHSVNGCSKTRGTAGREGSTIYD